MKLYLPSGLILPNCPSMLPTSLTKDRGCDLQISLLWAGSSLSGVSNSLRLYWACADGKRFWTAQFKNTKMDVIKWLLFYNISATPVVHLWHRTRAQCIQWGNLIVSPQTTFLPMNSSIFLSEWLCFLPENLMSKMPKVSVLSLRY